MWRLGVLVVSVGLLFAVAGCGGGDSSGTTNGETSSSAAAENGSKAAGSNANGESTGEQSGGASSGSGSSGAEAGAPSSEAQQPSAGQASGGGSRKEFIAAADAICKQDGHELTTQLVSKLQGNVESLSEPGVAEGLVHELWLPELEKQITELEALKGPPKAEAGLDEVIARIEDVMAEAQADPEKFAYKYHAFGKAEATAKKQGYKSCGGVR